MGRQLEDFRRHAALPARARQIGERAARAAREGQTVQLMPGSASPKRGWQGPPRQPASCPRALRSLHEPSNSRHCQRGQGRMARQFIYHMQGLSKTYPGNRKGLDNIHLSFYPDAKICVLGGIGPRQATLRRLTAGIDKDFVGEGWVAERARVGY